MERLTDYHAQQRRLLDALLFRLACLRHLMAGGAHRHLATGVAEVERATIAVAQFDIARAAEAHAAAAALGVEANDEGHISLSALADAAPEPWRSALLEHHRALVEVLEAIDEEKAAVRTLSVHGSKGIADILERLGAGESAVYGPDAVAVGGGSVRFEGSL